MKWILYTQLSHLPHKITRSGQKDSGPTDAFIHCEAAGRNDAVHPLLFTQGRLGVPDCAAAQTPLVPKGASGKEGGEHVLPMYTCDPTLNHDIYPSGTKSKELHSRLGQTPEKKT